MPMKQKMTPAEKKRLVEWGAEEAREHNVSMRMGIKLVLDHQKKFGDKYYPAVAKMEKRLAKKK